MTIKYCDFLNGNDTTGDGSRLNPYKTITKASTGLLGGDEVRVAKSPTPVNLAGTLSFTNGSTAVVSTNAIFVNAISAGETDGSVRLGDFVKGGDGNWWEVVSVTDSTHATLFQVYSGETASGISSQKLGVTNTGAAPEYGIIQEVSASGNSSNNLKIRGGWNLSTDTQDGQAYFCVPAELNGMNLVAAHACVYTASSSGTPTIQLYHSRYAADILSTAITIDATELNSYTAAVPPVINTLYDDVQTGDTIRIDVDVAGTGTKGLDVILSFSLP